jgi:hypothetical protein
MNHLEVRPSLARVQVAEVMVGLALPSRGKVVDLTYGALLEANPANWH